MSYAANDPPPVRIAIRTSPRDAGDVVMIACMVAFGLAIVFVPIAIAPRSMDRILFWLGGGAVGVLVLYGVVNFIHVVVDAQGIRLHRWHRWDLVLAWDEITALREVTRGEALMAAFCMPWRATHWGLSTTEVFCLHWGRGRRFYFPPADPTLFRQAVRRWRPNLLPPDEPAGNAPPAPETGNPYQAPRGH